MTSHANGQHCQYATCICRWTCPRCGRTWFDLAKTGDPCRKEAK